MNRYIARLIDSGMPRECAIRVCQYFKKHKSLDQLEEYVRAVEDESRVSMETV